MANEVFIIKQQLLHVFTCTYCVCRSMSRVCVQSAVRAFSLKSVWEF